MRVSLGVFLNVKHVANQIAHGATHQSIKECSHKKTWENLKYGRSKRTNRVASFRAIW